MRFISKKILIISPEPWGTSFVSKHHYALELSKNNTVYFLNPPTKKFGIKKISSSLFIVNYQPVFRGLGRMPVYLSAFFIKNEMNILEKKSGYTYDIIWNFDSSRFFNLSRLKNKLKIAHLVDLSEHFQRPLLAKTSDICFCTTEAIGEEMRKYNLNTFNIGHGVQKSENDIHLTNEEKNELKTSYKYRAAYVGNLSIKYLTWEIIHTIVKENLDIAFFFIGPLGKSNLSGSNIYDSFIEKVQSLPNVFFLGAKPFEKIPAYLRAMDILLLVYQSEKYKDQLANPHKMLEYLASGKVVVSSWTEEYKDKRKLLEMVESNKDLPKKFRRVISNLEYYNSKKKQTERKVYAFENSYEKKILQIENLINENL